MTTHDHDERAVEALAVKVFRAMYPMSGWSEQDAAQHCLAATVARFILSREAALKADAERLVAALERICAGTTRGPAMEAYNALSDWRASRQPKPSEPTLAEAVEAMLRSAPQIVFGSAPVDHAPLDADGVRLSLVRTAALDAVKAALARERETGGAR